MGRYAYTVVVSEDAGEILRERTVTFRSSTLLDWQAVEARVREAAPDAVSIVRSEWMIDDRR